MRVGLWALVALACGVLGGCGSADQPATSTSTSTPTSAAKTIEPVKITQFYTSTPQVPRGEKGLVCYGVENAKTVWISPPKQELSTSISRCIEVEPNGKTTYTLTAEGADGKMATREVTVEREATVIKVRLLNVNISAAEVNAGDAVSICYKVENAQSVSIEPTKFRGGAEKDGCVVDQPQKTSTYTVHAKGARGDTDEERVTIRVRAK